MSAASVLCAAGKAAEAIVATTAFSAQLLKSMVDTASSARLSDIKMSPQTELVPSTLGMSSRTRP